MAGHSVRELSGLAPQPADLEPNAVGLTKKTFESPQGPLGLRVQQKGRLSSYDLGPVGQKPLRYPSEQPENL